MQTVVLAGGLGQRLRPLTDSIPKPMMLVSGRPFLGYQLELLKNNGFNNFILCTGYLGEKVKDYFGDGGQLGVSIKYSEEPEPLGTGGALKNAEHMLENFFLLVYGDSFLDIDYKDAEKKFLESKKMGLTVIYKNSPKITPNNMELKDENIINYDKKKEGGANCVEAGVHFFKKDILGLIDKNKFSLEEDLLPVLIKNKQLGGYLTPERFYDIGTFERLNVFKKLKRKL